MAICEKTGLEFEAKTKRTKNHPAIMNALSKAEKDGFYREAIAALEASKGKLETVEAYIALIENAGNTKADAASAKFREEYAAKEAAKEARREREAQRQKLARAGYVWHNVGITDVEEADELGVEVGPDYALFAPDGEIVTVKQALAEIENPALAEARIEAAKQEAAKQYEEAQARIEAEQKAVQEALASEVKQPVLAPQIKNPTPVDEPDLFLFNLLLSDSEKDEQPKIVAGSEEEKNLQASKAYWEQRKKEVQCGS